jgi:hypothetical protein
VTSCSVLCVRFGSLSALRLVNASDVDDSDDNFVAGGELKVRDPINKFTRLAAGKPTECEADVRRNFFRRIINLSTARLDECGEHSKRLDANQRHVEETSAAVAAPYQVLQDTLAQQPVLNGDETGHGPTARNAGSGRWSPLRFVFYTIAPSPGSDVPRQLIGAHLHRGARQRPVVFTKTTV